MPYTRASPAPLPSPSSGASTPSARGMRYPYQPGHDPTAPPVALFDAPYLPPQPNLPPAASQSPTPRRPPRRRPPPRDEAVPLLPAQRDQRLLERHLFAELTPDDWGLPSSAVRETQCGRATRAWLNSNDTGLDAVPPLDDRRQRDRHQRSRTAGRLPRRPLVRRRASSDPFAATPPPSYSSAIMDRAPAYPFPGAPYNPSEDQPAPRAHHGQSNRDAANTRSPDVMLLGVPDGAPGYNDSGDEHEDERSRRRAWWKTGRRHRLEGGVGQFFGAVLSATT